jgi:hypothetical protein
VSKGFDVLGAESQLLFVMMCDRVSKVGAVLVAPGEDSDPEIVLETLSMILDAGRGATGFWKTGVG